jgi:hypothetical protein
LILKPEIWLNSNFHWIVRHRFLIYKWHSQGKLQYHGKNKIALVELGMKMRSGDQAEKRHGEDEA